MARPTKGVVLIQLGTPDSAETPDVRRYLREFLSDPRVIDIPAMKRWLLVNLIIAPLRAPKSSAEYKRLWTDEGSPLLVYGKQVEASLQQELGEDYKVVLAMRYQNPSMESALAQLEHLALDEIVAIPLFPQYASASTGSAMQKFNEVIGKWQVIPAVKSVTRYADDPRFIDVWKSVTEQFAKMDDYDHFLFSYHGLPERQILKASKNDCCKLGSCCNSYRDDNYYCYRAQCFATTRLLTKALGIPEEKYTVCFQSRLGKDPWIQPFTDVVLEDLAKSGVKKVLAFSPAFVADCLETTVEVGETYKEDFLKMGGEKWDLVPSLNNNPEWVKFLADLATQSTEQSSAIAETA